MEREIAQVEVVDVVSYGGGGARAENRRGRVENLRPFRPGQSGNPGGRPKQMAQVVELARAHTVDAIKALAQITNSKKASAPARVAAASALLDRGWGKAPQVLELGATGSFDEWLKARAAQLRDER